MTDEISAEPLSDGERAVWRAALALGDDLRALVTGGLTPRTGLSQPDFLVLTRLQLAPEFRTAGLKALVAAVRGGRIRAALDVTDPEPLPTGHPLWGLPGVLITPHIGGVTTTQWPRLEVLIRRQLERFAGGRELANTVAH